MPKNIIFCADGTWNGPDQDDKHPDNFHPTNVFKLFGLLDGDLAAPQNEPENEKRLMAAGATSQVAKYLHGVGDSSNPLVRIMGGVFGAGIITRIVRGYTFISREYEPGDHIFILGFSRGAYTARALAGFITSQGLLAKNLTSDKQTAYQKGMEAWYRYRKSSSHEGILQRLAASVAHLPSYFLAKTLEESDFYQIPAIKAVAVWDTVGAMGLPDIEGNRRVDDFGFADTKLNERVEWGFHAISMDEERVDFTPTLWDERAQIKQLIFPGAHSDVGGGYPMADGESMLSDGGLKWMVDELKPLGVAFAKEPAYDVAICPAGIAHEPWRGKPFVTARRDFPVKPLGHCSLLMRASHPEVYLYPDAKVEKYDPRHAPICNGGPERICASCVMM